MTVYPMLTFCITMMPLCSVGHTFINLTDPALAMSQAFAIAGCTSIAMAEQDARSMWGLQAFGYLAAGDSSPSTSHVLACSQHR